MTNIMNKLIHISCIDCINNIIKCFYSMYFTHFFHTRALLTFIGELIWSLNDKTRKWYWGTEMVEAILIGYRVTRVYEVKKYEKLDFIFKEWVTFCFDKRKVTKGGVNKSWKAILNDLTGKFGQGTIEEESYILGTPDSAIKNQKLNSFYGGGGGVIVGDENITETNVRMLQQKVFDRNRKNENFDWSDECIASISDFDLYYSQNNKKSFIFITKERKNPSPHYPVEFSAQILANSRRYMSKFYRANNSYLDPLKAVYYTDTDSLILHRSCRDLLSSFVGSELGKLACDLDDEFSKTSQPAKIVKYICGAPKGPYSVVFAKYHTFAEELVLEEKVRLKGIPHKNEQFPHIESFIFMEDFEKEKEKMDRVNRFFKNPTDYPVPSDLIGDRIYYVESEKKNKEKNCIEITVEFAKSINFDLMEKIVFDPFVKVTAIFGTMQREFNNVSNNAMDGSKFATIKPFIIRREICKNLWWLNGKRRFLTADCVKNNVEDTDEAIDQLMKLRYTLSYPIGYMENNPDKREFIDYDNATWSPYYPKQNIFNFTTSHWDCNVFQIKQF